MAQVRVHVWGFGVGFAAALQLLTMLPHTPPRLTPREPMLELDRLVHPFWQAVLTRRQEYRGGVVAISDGPGLGIEIDRAALATFGLPGAT